MAKWRKKDSLAKAVGRSLAHEGRGVAEGVGKELLSIAMLGLYRRRRSWK